MRGLAGFVMLLTVAVGCATDRSGKSTRAEVLERILPASVQVVVEKDGRRLQSGSGVVIARGPAPQGTECYVLTSGHLLSRSSGEEEVYVRVGRHRDAGVKTPAAVLARQETDELDLALLGIHTGACIAAEPGGAPDLGDPIWVVAFPWGGDATLVSGIISQVNAVEPGGGRPGNRLLVDASVSYGSSGGGVFEAHTGRLVGLVEGYGTARVSFGRTDSPGYIDVPVPGLTYVAPLANIQRFLEGAGYPHLFGDDRKKRTLGE